MIERLKSLNKGIEFFDVGDKEFASFGRVIKGLDVSEIIAAAGDIKYPESGSAYVPSVEAFERLKIAA